MESIEKKVNDDYLDKAWETMVIYCKRIVNPVYIPAVDSFIADFHSGFYIEFLRAVKIQSNAMKENGLKEVTMKTKERVGDYDYELSPGLVNFDGLMINGLSANIVKNLCFKQGWLYAGFSS